MRASLIVLAVVLASLHVARAALARRVRRVSVDPSTKGRRSGAGGPSSLSLVEGVAAELGEGRGRRGVAARGDAGSSRFAEWRYYGLSSHGAEAGGTAAELSAVASSPAVGSVVTILPDDSVHAVVNGRIYWKSGSVWYRRQDIGSNVTYVVVHAP